MGFSTNYDGLSENSELLPEGEYECVIKSADLNTTKNGTPYFDVRFVVRNDVEQKYKNKYIFHSMWKKKEPTPADAQVDNFSFKQIMSLAKAVKLPQGKTYETLDQMGADMVGKPVLVTIEHNTYKDSTTERVKYTNESKYPDCRHVFKEAAQTTQAGYAQPQAQSFANSSPAVPTPNIPVTDDFEEIISDSDVPF